MINMRDKDWSARAINLVDGVVNDLIAAERENIELSQTDTVGDFEGISDSKEIIHAYEDAAHFVRTIDLGKADSRAAALKIIIEKLETTWLLTARGRGLMYRKSAEMLLKKMREKLAEIRQHGNLTIVSPEDDPD